MRVQVDFHQLLVAGLILVLLIGNDLDYHSGAGHFVHCFHRGTAQVLDDIVLIKLVLVALGIHNQVHCLFSHRLELKVKCQLLPLGKL